MNLQADFINQRLQILYTPSYTAPIKTYHSSSSSLLCTQDTIEPFKGKQPVVVEFYETDAGVLVSDPKKGPFIFFSWGGRSQHDTTLQGIYYLNKSQNLRQARKALSYHVSPPINAILADKYGNIAYQLVGKVGKRFFNDHLPVPLKKPYLVNEYIPYEDMPRSVNPESGIVYSTNNNVVSDQLYNVFRLPEISSRKISSSENLS